jgi:UDP-N-acetylglucosamine 2-epimerase (non-hydrolysing)
MKNCDISKDSLSMKIINIVGARPNFMKIAPIMKAYRAYPEITPLLIHTGQHYDEQMSNLFFHQLEIPAPDLNLEVGSATRTTQIAQIMQRFEPILRQEQPDLVVVVGDVNSTIACGLVAVDQGVKLAHVEAGLRSRDRTMPEETNRILTDSISDLLFCTEQSGIDNLLQEGIPAQKLHLVGNVMVDTLLHNRQRAELTTILEELELNGKPYGILTLHRPSNVDHEEELGRLLDALEVISQTIPVIFPVHPRTQSRLAEGRLAQRITAMTELRMVAPLGYLEFLKLMNHARVILTDSGGIQEESTILGIPCLTLRHNTERPITTTLGTNRLVGTDPRDIITAWKTVMTNELPQGQCPPYWDGHAAERIVDILYKTMTQ